MTALLAGFLFLAGFAAGVVVMAVYSVAVCAWEDIAPPEQEP